MLCYVGTNCRFKSRMEMVRSCMRNCNSPSGSEPLYTLGTCVIFLHIPKLDCKRQDVIDQFQSPTRERIHGNTDHDRESTRRKETLSTSQKRNDFRSPRPEPVPLAQAFSRTAGLLPNVGQPSTDQNGSGEPCLPKLFQWIVQNVPYHLYLFDTVHVLVDYRDLHDLDWCNVHVPHWYAAAVWSKMQGTCYWALIGLWTSKYIFSFLQPHGPQVAQTRALRHDHLEDKYRHRHPSLLGGPLCALNKALCQHFPARTSCSSVPAWKLFETNHKNMEFIEPAIFLACAERKGLCRETLLAALIERHAVGPIMARTTR